MATALFAGNVGDLLRDWRRQRRLSQLDLANSAEVSARHLSFVETGRSKPSRELVLHLANHLDVPARERNALLIAAGFAPVYSETPLTEDTMADVKAGLDKVLAGHEPSPAVIVNRHWELMSANGPALAVLTDGVDPELLAPPANVLRISLHPSGMAPRIVNLQEWSAHLLDRLRREYTLSGDPYLFELRHELLGYPDVAESQPVSPESASTPFIPLRLRSSEAVLTFFSTVTTFGTPLDLTLAELSIESFFPADAVTAAALESALAS